MDFHLVCWPNHFIEEFLFVHNVFRLPFYVIWDIVLFSLVFPPVFLVLLLHLNEGIFLYFHILRFFLCFNSLFHLFFRLIFRFLWLFSYYSLYIFTYADTNSNCFHSMSFLPILNFLYLLVLAALVFCFYQLFNFWTVVDVRTFWLHFLTHCIFNFLFFGWVRDSDIEGKIG